MAFPPLFNITALNGTNGFVFTNNLPGSLFGWSASNLGDINKDGKSDLIVTVNNMGQAFVLFGASSFAREVHSSSLNGENGFLVIGGESFTPSCSTKGIGDINKDGIRDFIVGQCDVDKVYVIFGAKAFPPRLTLTNIDTKDGFLVTGANFSSASDVGDINDDGTSDFIVGSSESNSAFVVYGASTFASIFDVSELNGSNGFRIVGPLGSYFGKSVAGIGDFNGDGRPDLAIGMWLINQAAIVFGTSNFPAVMGTSSLNGSNGFIINGPALFGGTQQSVDGIGDFNGDHLADLAIGCVNSSSAFIIFGGRHFNATFDVSQLDGANGLKLVSPPAGPQGSAFGADLSGVNSINGNGRSSIIVGAMQTGINEASGSAYVFFGSDHFPPILNATDLNGTNGLEIVGNINAGLADYVCGIDNLLGDGKPSIVIGAVLESKVYVILDASST